MGGASLRDVAALQNGVIVAAAVVIVANLIVAIIRDLLGPRLRIASEEAAP